MTETFDPYRRWLAVPPGERPPNHYALLGLSLFEEDVDAISNAADRTMAYVRSHQTGPHAALTQQLLNELAAARVCLLNGEKKARYDAELRAKQASLDPAAFSSPASLPRPIPLPASTSGASARAIDLPAPPLQPQMAPQKLSERRALRGLPGWVPPAAGGLAAGILLAWIAMSSIGDSQVQNDLASTLHSSASSGDSGAPSAATASENQAMAAILKSIKAPSPLGVVADKLVIWNTHGGRYQDRGALECNVRLLADDREVWSKQGLAIPWAAAEDHNLTLALPPNRFDCVRIEITKWEQNGGGLSEIQVLSADGRNLAFGCPAIASGAWSPTFGPQRIADGVTTSAMTKRGDWLLPDKKPGWIEVDLSVPRPEKPTGVTAEKLVIWNQHNGPHNNHGALECNVRLLSGDREAWAQSAVEIPWSPNEDSSLALPLPSTSFDRVRIELTKWMQAGAGLAEIQILSADGSNLALDCPVLASAISDGRRREIRATDGIVSSSREHVGYWLLPEKMPGWIEVDLACLDADYGAACRQLGLALALVDGDWRRGLRWLARGDHQALRRLARADLPDDLETTEQIAVADTWWDLAQQAEGRIRERLLARSLWRYRKTLDAVHEFSRAWIGARIEEALPSLPDRDFLFFMPETELRLGWGEFRASTPVSIQGVLSPYGLWLHPGAENSSHAAFQIGKRYRRFRGAAAINDWSNGLPTALTFRIVGDGRELWKSSPLQSAGASESFDVDIAGVGKLELFVDCPGSNFNAHSVWVEPRLVR